MQIAAVLGAPVSHSLSPVLHEAAYRELGHPDWEYTKIECQASDLPRIVETAPSYVRGFSVTMPGKEAALEFADKTSERAKLVGSANTLVRCADGWYADCTDIDGAIAAIRKSGWKDGPVLMLGAGGTSRPYLAALQNLHAKTVYVASRSRERAAKTLQLAQTLGVEVTWVPLLDSDVLSNYATKATLLISTLPADAAAAYSKTLQKISRFVDVTYSPWPTTLARAIATNEGVVVGGLTMLLHQAITQVELFTGEKVTPQVRQSMKLALPE